MRRLITLIIIIIFTISTAYSQKISVGVYYSMNKNYRTYSNDYDYLDDYDEKVNLFNFGLLYERYLLDNLSISSGVDFAKEGYNRNPIFITSAYIYSTKYRFNYVGIPLEANYYLLNKGFFKIGLNLGLNFKFLVKAKTTPYNILYMPLYRFSYTSPETESYSFKELKDRKYNMLNINTNAGIKFLFNLKGFSIGISPEYRLSLIPTNKIGIWHVPKEKLYSYGLKLTILKNNWR